MDSTCKYHLHGKSSFIHLIDDYFYSAAASNSIGPNPSFQGNSDFCYDSPVAIASDDDEEDFYSTQDVSPKAVLHRPVVGSQVPCCPIDKNISNCWSPFDPSKFKIRGRNYSRYLTVFGMNPKSVVVVQYCGGRIYHCWIPFGNLLLSGSD